MSKRFGEAGLPEGTLRVALHGHAGQSLGAWLAKGIELHLEGDANDYVGKGLSGGVVSVRPPADAPFVAQEQVRCHGTDRADMTAAASPRLNELTRSGAHRRSSDEHCKLTVQTAVGLVVLALSAKGRLTARDLSCSRTCR